MKYFLLVLTELINKVLNVSSVDKSQKRFDSIAVCICEF
jgi:hypothetical protein